MASHLQQPKQAASPYGYAACMPAPRAHRWEDEMESSSRGKREQGTKVVAVKLQSKKVDWRLAARKIFYVSYILKRQ